MRLAWLLLGHSCCQHALKRSRKVVPTFQAWGYGERFSSGSLSCRLKVDGDEEDTSDAERNARGTSRVRGDDGAEHASRRRAFWRIVCARDFPTSRNGVASPKTV